MSLDDSSPNSSESGVVRCCLDLVDVGNSLSKVEAGVLLVVHSLDFKKSEVFILGGYTSFEASEYSFGVESIKER